MCVAILGAVLTTAGATSLLNSRRNATPGRLVADQDSIVWEGPSERSSSPIQASARFIVTNVGGRPVRITETESSCGCAVPSVSPAVVPPGGTSVISVEATPILVGEKVALITLKTDSTESPEVGLRLHIMGNRRPPFLLKTGGELSFTGEFSPDETREFLVRTIEPEGASTKPVIGNPTPFLTVSAPTITSKPHVLPGIVEKQYTYRVAISGEPPVGAFRSQIIITDPWDKDRKEYVPVSIEKAPPFRVIPSRLLLTADSEGRANPATFVVKSRVPIPNLEIEIDGGKAGPLVAEVVNRSEDQRSVTARLSLNKHDRPREGLHEIHLRPGSPSNEVVTVPVMVREAKP